jgi:predicted nucleic acid-binding protein
MARDLKLSSECAAGQERIRAAAPHQWGYPELAEKVRDFADAMLVHRARRERLNLVFTIDHDDFETHRIDGRRPLRIVPDR